MTRLSIGRIQHRQRQNNIALVNNTRKNAIQPQKVLTADVVDLDVNSTEALKSVGLVKGSGIDKANQQAMGIQFGNGNMSSVNQMSDMKSIEHQGLLCNQSFNIEKKSSKLAGQVLKRKLLMKMLKNTNRENNAGRQGLLRNQSYGSGVRVDPVVNFTLKNIIDAVSKAVGYSIKFKNLSSDTQKHIIKNLDEMKNGDAKIILSSIKKMGNIIEKDLGSTSSSRDASVVGEKSGNGFGKTTFMKTLVYKTK